MSNVLHFPETIRIQDFQAEAALKQQIRMALGGAIGVFHGDPTKLEYREALLKIDEALTLMQAYSSVAYRE
jgi:hypothetical protein